MAHYLCALLDSTAVNLIVEAHSVWGGKGFGSPSPFRASPYLPVRERPRVPDRHVLYVLGRETSSSA